MKNWKAADWSLIILSLTIFLSIIGVMMIRLITGSPISDKGAEVINNILDVVGGGVLTILGGKIKAD